MKNVSFGFLLLSALVVFSGCGGPKMQDVSGTITYKGEPVEGATVTFSPSDGGKHIGSAVTGSDGKYVLKTAGETGAVAGAYSVLVVKREEVAEDSEEKAHSEAEAGKEVDAAEPKSLIPEKYASKKGGLTAEIKAGEAGVFDFELKD